MPATTSENLAFPGRNRDTEDTPITNDPSNEGFPAKTQNGELVFIVRTERDGLKKVLVTADGTKYLDDGVAGYLKPYSEEVIEDGTVDPDVHPNASDEAAAAAMEVTSAPEMTTSAPEMGTSASADPNVIGPHYEPPAAA